MEWINLPPAPQFLQRIHPNKHGKYTWKNGNTYDGHWKQGLTNGIGKYRWVKEKATYEGPFKDGQLESVEIEASVETPEKESK